MTASGEFSTANASAALHVTHRRQSVVHALALVTGQDVRVACT